MNNQLKEVRAILKRAREAAGCVDLTRAQNTLIEQLTNAVDVLTGEVERLDACGQRVNTALVALLDTGRILGESIKTLFKAVR